MKPDLSAPALVQLLHRYYPAGLWCDDPAYKASEEAQRLTQLLVESQKNTRVWEHFVQRVSEEFPGGGLWDTTLLWIDPCHRLRVSLPSTARTGDQRDAIICLVSLLVPAYVIYAPHFLPLPLAPLIESTFGATRLPNDVLFTPVPNLSPRTGNVALGKARLIDLLFTPDLW